MFEMRATEPELLDDPACDQALSAESYRFMTMINAFTGGTAVVRRFIAEKARENRRGAVIRILDIGSGSCDIPIAISRWARARGIRLQITCLEPSSHAFDIAGGCISAAGDPEISVVREDVFKHQPVEPYDHATASMCFHHFRDEEILDVLKRLRLFVRGSVLINDLRRTPAALLGAYLLTTGLSAGVRHDAMQSVRRGFKVEELQSLLQQIPDSMVTVKAAWCLRVAAVVGFKPLRVR